MSQESSVAETSVSSFDVTVASPIYAFVLLSKRFIESVASKATVFALSPAAEIARFLATVFAATSTDRPAVTVAPPSMKASVSLVWCTRSTEPPKLAVAGAPGSNQLFLLKTSCQPVFPKVAMNKALAGAYFKSCGMLPAKFTVVVSVFAFTFTWPPASTVGDAALSFDFPM